jgi:type I restriction enzyme R subunit
MATGTGKTRTCIGLLYRLIKAKRFRRILFLVDRTSLGDQASDAFRTLQLDQNRTFTEIYDLKSLGDITPESDTRVQIATIQGLVMRVLYSDDNVPPVDQYDCIVVDECHRGYSLDREMSDAELTFRSEADYVSKYRRVLDHFDAVKIGLTATPALHTTEIFGDPIFTYSYRKAVIEGRLVDHEPPIRITTKLGDEGIKWKADEEMEVYNTRTHQLDLIHSPDEVHVEIEGFNKHVITEAFNKTVCTELAQHIDPDEPGKTLIFCSTDAHADMVVRLLKEAFAEAYGEIEDDAVLKITGAADKPTTRIRHYKNERNPRVAVTVDLLTTGINVPEITNLVFLRRVRSRILYEQMMGRATRLCNSIGKRFFRIYDAVDLYAALLPHTSMKPVVVNPTIRFTQLAQELASLTDDTALGEVRDQLVAKLRRKLRAMSLDDIVGFEDRAGSSPEALLSGLRDWDLDVSSDWWRDRLAVATWLDELQTGDGPVQLISHHDDELRDVVRGYGDADKPEDYLDAFGTYIREHINDIPALMVVTQRPRDLTRAQLRDLKLALDTAGYTEAILRVAWRETTNQDIAATIIGFIRQQALGSALKPYGDRVKAAMDRVMASRAWTGPQRRWLERIGKQVAVETVVDRDALDRGQFAAMGGYKRLNKVFGGELESILGEIGDAVWEDVG